jgi:cbb3-type cytochrome oxidase subunit 3
MIGWIVLVVILVLLAGVYWNLRSRRLRGSR